MKYQVHTPHLKETYMCNSFHIHNHISSKLLFVILIEFCMHQQKGKDAEERAGSSKFMLHAVPIAKRKEAEF